MKYERLERKWWETRSRFRTRKLAQAVEFLSDQIGILSAGLTQVDEDVNAHMQSYTRGKVNNMQIMNVGLEVDMKWIQKEMDTL